MNRNIFTSLFAFFIILILAGIGLFSLTKFTRRIETEAPKATTNPTPTIKLSRVTIETKMGEEFSIVLWRNPSTGYDWKFDFNPNYIVSTGESLEGEVGEEDMVGAPSQGTYTFKALLTGETDMTALYLRSFEKRVPPEEVKIYHIKISQ